LAVNSGEAGGDMKALSDVNKREDLSNVKDLHGNEDFVLDLHGSEDFQGDMQVSCRWRIPRTESTYPQFSRSGQTAPALM